MSRPRVLVLRALGLGDLLTGVPALRGIRRALPDHELVLVAPEWLRPIVDLVGCVDRLLPSAGLAPIPWTGAAPDVAVDLHGRGPESHRLLTRLAPGRLVAFDCPDAGVRGPRHDLDEHEVRRWTRLVAESFDVPVAPDDLAIAEPARGSPVPGAVVLHVGAAAPARRWPAGRFADVAAWCVAHDLQVAVTGGAHDVGAARVVMRGAGLPDSACLAGRTDLTDLAAVVAHARLVVAGDTGVAHLASAYRRPSVLLFGPVHPDHWGPPDDRRHQVIAHGAGEGDPHGDTVDPALSRITVADVLDRLGPLLQSATGPAQAPASGRSATYA